MEYILFIFQEANFQSRSILVPKELFLKVREDDYNMLKKHSIKNVAIKGDTIDNLLIQDYWRDGNCCHQRMQPFTRICGELAGYADRMEDRYYDLSDCEWVDNSITNICGGFNHVKNYVSARHIEEIEGKRVNIVEGFLVLKSQEGKLNMSPFDTVDEMLLKVYGIQNVGC